MVRSVFPDILLRFAGGGPSLSAAISPSGAGEPFCECCCEAGGEGYGMEGMRGRIMAAGGGLGERDRKDNGEQEREEAGALLLLLSREERPESEAMGAGGGGVGCLALRRRATAGRYSAGTEEDRRRDGERGRVRARAEAESRPRQKGMQRTTTTMASSRAARNYAYRGVPVGGEGEEGVQSVIYVWCRRVKVEEVVVVVVNEVMADGSDSGWRNRPKTARSTHSSSSGLWSVYYQREWCKQCRVPRRDIGDRLLRYMTISRYNSFIPNIIDNTEHLAMNEASSYASARRHHNNRARQQAWLCSFAFVEYLVELTRRSWHSKPSKMSPFVLVP